MKSRLILLALLTLSILVGGYYFYSQKGAAAITGDIELKPILKGFTAKVDAEPKPEEETVTVQFFGDMMLERNVAKNMSARGLDYLFAKVPSTTLFVGADLQIANLEGPFAKTRIKTSKEIAFRFDPKLAPELINYGFDAFSLANNHSYDMGAKNVSYTREVLKNVGLGFFGDELKEGADFTWISNAELPFKIAFLGLHNTYHELNLNKVKNAIAEAQASSSFVIVNVHWGDEYKLVSNKKQQTLGKWLIDNGADVVIGHHPHVTQEIEIYKNKPIFYSLGNFIFDQYFSKDTQEGYSVVIKFSKEKIKNIKLIPYYGVKSQVFVMEGDRREKYLNDLVKRSRLLSTQVIDGEVKF